MEIEWFHMTRKWKCSNHHEWLLLGSSETVKVTWRWSFLDVLSQFGLRLRERRGEVRVAWANTMNLGMCCMGCPWNIRKLFQQWTWTGVTFSLKWKLISMGCHILLKMGNSNKFCHIVLDKCSLYVGKSTSDFYRLALPCSIVAYILGRILLCTSTRGLDFYQGLNFFFPFFFVSSSFLLCYIFGMKIRGPSDSKKTKPENSTPNPQNLEDPNKQFAYCLSNQKMTIDYRMRIEATPKVEVARLAQLWTNITSCWSS